MAHGRFSGPGLYIVVALILGVVTYIEFYLVEHPVVWLGPGWTLFWLVTLSLTKFWMVIWFFMHLRDDDKLYTGFFSSGMVIALGTFVALAFLFLLPRAVTPVIAALEPPAVPHAVADPLSEHVRALIDSDGRSRPIAQRASAPPPKDQSARPTPPAPEEGTFTVRLEGLDLPAVGEPAAEPAAEEPAEEPAAEEEPPEAEAAEAAPDEPGAAAEPDPTFDRELGAQVFGQSCVACHQATGMGVPGAFPPLAGHAIEFFGVEGGRTVLIDIVLFGLQGPITVRGQNYNGVMPPWQQLSDEQIAAVLNHVAVGFEEAVPDGFNAIRADEVAAERPRGLAPTDVHGERQALGLD